MTLSRLVNYVDGNVLTGAQLNNEFDNILNNGASLVTLSVPSYSAVSGLIGTMISNVGSFQANAYQLKSTSVICSLTATSSYSINTQTAGPVANGRDQAAVFGSTDVHFYAITTGGTSTTAAGICSTRPPNIGPTLPAGYSAWAYLASAKYSTASSAVGASMNVIGSHCYYATPPEVITTGVAVVETAVSLVPTTAGVPSVALSYDLNLYRVSALSSSSGIADVTHSVRAVTGVDFLKLLTFGGSNNLAGNSRIPGGSGQFTLPNLNTAPGFYYLHTITVGTSAALSAALVSYVVPNGDVG